MKITVLCLVFLLPFLTQAQKKKEMNLEAYKWENRLLLLFAASENNAELIRQKELNRKNMHGVAATSGARVGTGW